jgi:hypothetical protein
MGGKSFLKISVVPAEGVRDAAFENYGIRLVGFVARGDANVRPAMDEFGPISVPPPVCAAR